MLLFTITSNREEFSRRRRRNISRLKHRKHKGRLHLVSLLVDACLVEDFASHSMRQKARDIPAHPPTRFCPVRKRLAPTVPPIHPLPRRFAIIIFGSDWVGVNVFGGDPSAGSDDERRQVPVPHQLNPAPQSKTIHMPRKGGGWLCYLLAVPPPTQWCLSR